MAKEIELIRGMRIVFRIYYLMGSRSTNSKESQPHRSCAELWIVQLLLSHDLLPLVHWHCWMGIRKSIRHEWWGAGMVISLEWGAENLHVVQLMSLPPIISCFIKIQNDIPLWCRLTPVVLEKEAIKWVSRSHGLPSLQLLNFCFLIFYLPDKNCDCDNFVSLLNVEWLVCVALHM